MTEASLVSELKYTFPNTFHTASTDTPTFWIEIETTLNTVVAINFAVGKFS